jgi:Domain of unknown function (DUF4173)
MSISVSQDQTPGLKAERPADAKAWRPGQLGFRFLAAFVAAVATGIIAHHDWPGSIIALVCAIPLALLFWQQADLRFTFDGLISAAFTGIAWTGVLIEPGPLNLSLFWLGLAAFALVRRGLKLASLSAALEVILRNIGRAPFRLFADAGSAWALKRNVQISTGWIANLVLPVLAIIIFGALLAVSNPLIADFLALFSWSKPFDYLLSSSTPLAVVTFLVLWIAMRMSPLAAKLDAAMSWAQPVWHSAYFKLAPVTITLLLLNAMFAAQNVLDYTYIWNGVTLPPGMSMVEYVHRGSYSLIATALLAGALIIAMFQPGSATSDSRLVRNLVYVFAAQNVLLVASSAMRTMVYVDESGLTLWRISAFIWMGLVATGLALIALRVMVNKSNLWLLNTNLAAALLVLLASGIINYNSIVAETNVNRALARLPADTRTQSAEILLELDVPYLLSLGPSAIPALEHLLNGTSGFPSLAMWAPQNLSDNMQSRGIYISSNAHVVLKSLTDDVRRQTQSIQSDWRTWTLRFFRKVNQNG